MATFYFENKEEIDQWHQDFLEAKERLECLMTHVPKLKVISEKKQKAKLKNLEDASRVSVPAQEENPQN